MKNTNEIIKKGIQAVEVNAQQKQVLDRAAELTKQIKLANVELEDIKKNITTWAGDVSQFTKSMDGINSHISVSGSSRISYDYEKLLDTLASKELIPLQAMLDFFVKNDIATDKLEQVSSFYRKNYVLDIGKIKDLKESSEIKKETTFTKVNIK